MRKSCFVAILFILVGSVGCRQAEQAELARAKADAEAAKAALARLQQDVDAKKPAEPAKDKGDPDARGTFTLESLDRFDRLLTGLVGDGYQPSRVWVFRFTGRGVPQCWLADDQGKTVLGPVPDLQQLASVHESNRIDKRDPLQQGYVTLALRNGKARLAVTASPVPGQSGAGVTAHAEGDFPHLAPKGEGVFTAGGTIERRSFAAHEEIKLLEYDGRVLRLRFEPTLAPDAIKR